MKWPRPKILTSYPTTARSLSCCFRILNMAVHGGRKEVFIYMLLAVVRRVAVFKRTMQAYWICVSVADIFLRLARHWSAENRQKNSPKRHRAKGKTINCVNLKSSDMATLETSWLPKSPPKLTPAFLFDCTKCGEVWTSNVVYLRAVKVSLTKDKIQTLLCKR